MVIVADNDPKVSMHNAAAKFRKIMVGKSFPDQIKRESRCHESTGHILIVRNNRIVCERCDAQWKDEGF